MMKLYVKHIAKVFIFCAMSTLALADATATTRSGCNDCCSVKLIKAKKVAAKCIAAKHKLQVAGKLDLSRVKKVVLPGCPPGADITKLALEVEGVKPAIEIPVSKNFPDNGEEIILRAKHASQATGGKDVLFIVGDLPHAHLQFKNTFANSSLRSQHNLYMLDTRGQGESEKPLPIMGMGPETVYFPFQNWANDINTAIQVLGLTQPVLVAAGVGVIYVNDYLREFGDGDICAIVTVGALPDPILTPASQNQWISPEFLALLNSGDLFVRDFEQYIPATQQLIDLSSECTLQPQDLQEILIYDSFVSGAVRGGIVNHAGLPPFGMGLPSPNDAVWAVTNVPVKVIHGTKDNIFEFTASEHLASVLPNADLCLLNNVGHFVGLEDPERFNQELLDFLDTL